MAADRHDTESARELRLEGSSLLLGGGFLLALIVGAFFVGRWVERQANPPAEAMTGQSGNILEQVVREEPDADATQGLTHFDQVDGDEQQLEGRREIPRRRTTPEPAAAGEQPAAEARLGTENDGSYYVQVLALRDQAAAAEVIQSLRKNGYDVRLFTEKEGQGSMLYKVRVGGFATRELASTAREELRRAGHPGAFVWSSG